MMRSILLNLTWKDMCGQLLQMCIAVKLTKLSYTIIFSSGCKNRFIFPTNNNTPVLKFN